MGDSVSSSSTRVSVHQSLGAGSGELSIQFIEALFTYFSRNRAILEFRSRFNRFLRVLVCALLGVWIVALIGVILDWSITF